MHPGKGLFVNLDLITVSLPDERLRRKWDPIRILDLFGSLSWSISRGDGVFGPGPNNKVLTHWMPCVQHRVSGHFQMHIYFAYSIVIISSPMNHTISDSSRKRPDINTLIISGRFIEGAQVRAARALDRWITDCMIHSWDRPECSPR
jgi:hypothetical protein